MKKKLTLFGILLVMNVTAMLGQDVVDGVVDIVYDGKKATYSIPDNVKGVTIGTNGAKVTVLSTTTSKEYKFRLSGSSPNGSFTLNAQYKLAVELNGLTLTNTSGGAAIDIECGKRIDVVLTEGTVSTICDSNLGDQKGAFYTKGHAEFKGGGTLNITGKNKHAIAVKEYCELKSSLGTINVLGAVSDGIHCGKGDKNDTNNYFLMKGGTVSISNVGSDGIDCDDYSVLTIQDGKLDIAIGDDATALKADSTVNIIGGTIGINIDGQDSKGIRANYAVNIAGGQSTIVANGDGSKGIKANRYETGKLEVLGGGNLYVSGGNTSISVTGGNYITTDANGVADTTKCMGMSIDADFIMTGGELSIVANGKDAHTYNVKGTKNMTGGTLSVKSSSTEVTLKGDVNSDGSVDVADISAIISIMAKTNDWGGNGDVNGDGYVDVADISTVITIMSIM